jgi:hypothetical protein
LRNLPARDPFTLLALAHDGARQWLSNVQAAQDDTIVQDRMLRGFTLSDVPLSLRGAARFRSADRQPDLARDVPVIDFGRLASADKTLAGTLQLHGR